MRTKFSRNTSTCWVGRSSLSYISLWQFTFYPNEMMRWSNNERKLRHRRHTQDLTRKEKNRSQPRSLIHRAKKQCTKRMKHGTLRTCTSTTEDLTALTQLKGPGAIGHLSAQSIHYDATITLCTSGLERLARSRVVGPISCLSGSTDKDN